MQLTPILLAASVVLAPHTALSQSTTITTRLALVTLAPACAVSGSASLNFGTWYRPTGAAAGSIASSAVTGTLGSPTNLTAVTSGTGIATATISAEHASSATISTSLPAALTSGSSSVSFAGEWAYRSGSSWIKASGTSQTLSGSGQRASDSWSIRLAGAVTGVTRATAAAAHKKAVSVSVACT